MGLSLFARFEWAIAAVLEAAVLFFALRRRLFEQHPLLTIYLGLLVLYEGAIWLTFEITGIRSRSALYAYFALQSLLLACRGAAVYEICQVMLASFLGVWKLCRGFLLLISAALIITAILVTSQSGPRISAIMSAADRGLELAIVGVLVFGLASCRYYHIRIPGYLVWIGLGFGFYSAVQVINSTFLRHFLLAYFPIWNNVGIFSFNIATILWCIALWRPLPALKLAPAGLGPEVYNTLAPQVTSRLRELNARLLEMWK